MDLLIFSVYDMKAGAYLEPFFMLTKGQAMRAFGDGVNDGKSVFNKHPEDYSLWQLGVFYAPEGKISALPKGPEELCKALSLISRGEV